MDVDKKFEFRNGKFYVKGMEANCIECLCSKPGQDRIFTLYQEEQELGRDYSYKAGEGRGMSDANLRALLMRAMIGSFLLRRTISEIPVEKRRSLGIASCDQ